MGIQGSLTGVAHQVLLYLGIDGERKRRLKNDYPIVAWVTSPVVPARGKRQAYCKGFRGRLVCCSFPRSLPRHQPDQVLTSLPPTCERVKVNCAYLHLRCAKCAMIQPHAKRVPQVQMWAGSMNYPASTVRVPRADDAARVMGCSHNKSG